MHRQLSLVGGLFAAAAALFCFLEVLMPWYYLYGDVAYEYRQSLIDYAGISFILELVGLLIIAAGALFRKRVVVGAGGIFFTCIRLLLLINCINRVVGTPYFDDSGIDQGVITAIAFNLCVLLACICVSLMAFSKSLSTHRFTAILATIFSTASLLFFLAHASYFGILTDPIVGERAWMLHGILEPVMFATLAFALHLNKLGEISTETDDSGDETEHQRFESDSPSKDSISESVETPMETPERAESKLPSSAEAPNAIPDRAAAETEEESELPCISESSGIEEEGSENAGSIKDINTWKTSIGASVAGAIVYAVVYGLCNQFLPPWPQGTVITVLLVVAITLYALFFYPSLFTNPGKQKNSAAVSFFNLFFGGIIFGCLWNHNLTRGEIGMSHIILSVIIIIALAGLTGWMIIPLIG